MLARRDLTPPLHRRKHPIATKRALPAILKGADLCALEPARAVRALVDGGFTPNYDYALQTMKDVPYNRWRTYDPEDSLRFYALRLREAGMIRSTPQRLIARARTGGSSMSSRRS